MGKITVKKTHHKKVYKEPNVECGPDMPAPEFQCTYHGKFVYCLMFRTNQAANNFWKHSRNNDTKKIEAMFKRGSIIKRPMNGLQVL